MSIKHENRCPACGMTPGTHEHIPTYAHDVQPAAGDLTICAGCCALLVIRIDMTYALLPDAERSALHPETQALIADTQKSVSAEIALRKRRHRNGYCGPKCILCRCLDLQHLVGLAEAAARAALPENADVEALHPGEAITADWAPERIVMQVDAAGVVTSLRRG